MQADLLVGLDAVVKAVWAPRVGEEDDGDGLAVIVQLQTAAPDRIHHGRVVDDLNRDR